MRVPLGELRGKRGDVFPVLAERRHDQLDDGQPIVEVHAEAAATRLGGEVAVRARDHTDVDVLDAARADLLDLAFLEHAKQLRLHRHGKLSDFVEDQRSAVRNRKEPLPRAVGPGESAPRVAEQLGLGQLGGNRGAVEPDQRLRCAGGLCVHERGDDLLAGTRLAAEENRDVLRPDERHGLEQLAHRGRLGHDAPCRHFRIDGSQGLDRLQDSHGFSLDARRGPRARLGRIEHRRAPRRHGNQRSGHARVA